MAAARPEIPANLENHDLNIKNLSNIFVNQGPGKFSGIRASLATAKALSFVNKINLYGFNSDQVVVKQFLRSIARSGISTVLKISK